ncbi:hypothetical protein ASG40_08395 [Methylobacterium sp. Leaf399]|uniref:hypothetical protein n=1 Tax=Methylobacterium sp. Leaf399 TaxID=1736364 RepID=UPI000712F3F8|nr:hypothetical protein [Methylobacterium sp. Leaf399]KQT11989.1 hypothetical protein ASG40_08395 [Methylobacterium sp. Leaf399]
MAKTVELAKTNPTGASGRVAAATALALFAGPALAAGEIPFEKAGGWEIERAARGPACMMSKSYKDPADDNAGNALVFALAGDKVVMTFVYEHWTWDKNEKIRVPLVLDKTTAIAKSAWTGDGQTLTAELPATIVPNLLAAKTMILKLDGADADFNLAGFPQGYESLRRCDSAPAAVVAAAAPPAPAPAGASPAAATPSAHVAQAMTFPGDGDVPPQAVFARDTPKILVAVEVRGVKPGDTLTATWVAEKTGAAAPPNFTIASVAIPLGASPLVSSSVSKPDTGWPPGQYRVDLSHNGGPVEFRQRFAIKE